MSNSTEIDLSIVFPDFWENLSERERQLLQDTYRVVSFKKGQYVHHESDKPTHLMCLVNGKIKIIKEGVGGRSQIIRMMRPVQFFGYRAYLAEETYNTSAVAVEHIQVCQIPMSIVVELIRSNHEVAFFFIRMLSVDLGLSDSRSVNLTQKHIRGRLAEALMFLIQNYGLESDGVTINIYLSREDLANLSNMTTSNAIRTLANFASEKIIAVDGRKIMVLDMETLTRISKYG